MEIHHVTTLDNYVLQLHRIPYGRLHNRSHGSYPNRMGRPIFLQHGVFSSSACWLLNPTDKAIGSLQQFVSFGFQLIRLTSNYRYRKPIAIYHLNERVRNNKIIDSEK